jgi:uncharacterized membrane protein YdfJ with MMPL/SSD domain
VATIGRWSSRHPGRAIAAWAVFVVVAVAAGIATGTESLDNGAVGDSGRGYALLSAHGGGPPEREYGYLHSDTLRTTDSGFRAAISDVARRMHAELGSEIETRVSADGHRALLVGTVEHRFSTARLRTAVLAAGSALPQVTIEQTGDISANDARDNAINHDLHRAELLSIPVTLLVLLLAFGAVVAALVPVLLALTAVIAAFGLLGPISQAFGLDDATKTVVLLIGMAVGVDYALFYVIRAREERRRGRPPHEALENTIRTSGRTVIVSGSTVAIAMAGMYVIGSLTFNGIASGTIAVIACAVAGSVTVLPAVLELLGSGIDRGRIPFLRGVRTEPSGSGFWPAIVGAVTRRPVVALVLSAGALLALAAPALGLHVAKPSNEALASKDDSVLATLGRVRAAFPGTASPALVVITGPPAQQANVLHQVMRLESLVVTDGISHGPFTLSGNSDQTVGSFSIPLTGAGDNPASRNAIGVLRQELIPATIGRVAGVETFVTGDTAEDIDFTRQMKHGVPYVVAFVLVFAFGVLLIAFRSIVVPLKAIVLNLLSVGASYGVLVLVFQHHWAEGLLGFKSNGAIISWLPLFLFVVLFGLSMDYHVFILSRVRELVDSGESTDDAVRHGIAATAGVVTSAALVMIAVFSLFGTLSALELKETGVGLATAVLIDATIVRAVLLPASMKLLGEWNWYLPPVLERLRRVIV